MEYFLLFETSAAIALAVRSRSIDCELSGQAGILAVDGVNDMAFLKCAFFEMIQDQLEKGNEPLQRLLDVSAREPE